MGVEKERRHRRRYRIVLDLRWKLVRRRKVLDSGGGATIDLSSGGIRFDAGRQLPIGAKIELSISWPALLHKVAPMLLVVSGHIVRSAGAHAAIEIGQHEFRTAGVLARAAVRLINAPRAQFPQAGRALVERLQ